MENVHEGFKKNVRSVAKISHTILDWKDILQLFMKENIKLWSMCSWKRLWIRNSIVINVAKSNQILMWFLWKFLHSKTKFEDSHQECSWRQKKLQMWHLQKYLFISAKPSHSQECCLCDKLLLKKVKIKTVAHVENHLINHEIHNKIQM